jgi:hypothetical protein
MLHKIKSFVKNNVDETVILNGIIGGVGALAFYYYAQYKLQAEMFNQVDKSLDALGLTDVVVDHMQTHVYPKLK